MNVRKISPLYYVIQNVPWIGTGSLRCPYPCTLHCWKCFYGNSSGASLFQGVDRAAFYDNTKAGTYTDSVELILNTTGPFLTTRIYDNSKYQERITLIPAELIAPITHSDIRKIMKEETS